MRELRNDWFSPVTHVVSDRSALLNKRHVVLAEIDTRNVKAHDDATTNFRDNLRFELLRAGFTVEFVKSSPKKDKADDKGTRTTRSHSGLFVRGYVFEARTGELLDEQTTTGVYLSVGVPGGATAAHLRYIGETSLSTYADSAEVGRLFAERLKLLTRKEKKRAWLPW